MKIVHYVVDTDTPLGTVLAALRADASAVSEGRVFVGKTRALTSTLLVPAGTTVAYTQRGEAAPEVRILHQGNGLLVVDKPVGMPTIPDLHGKSHALMALAARAAGLPEKSLHPTSRLDRDVSGVVTFATTPSAQKLLAEARDRGMYERRYVALAAMAPTPRNGTCEARIGRAKDPRHRKVDSQGEVACSRYVSVATANDGKVTLLALSPVTGRTHQLRVHASHLGAPLLGDKTYGGPTRLALGTAKILGFARIYLHCAGVRFPLAGAPSGILSLRSEVPSALLEAWSALGGEASAWEVATAWDTAFG